MWQSQGASRFWTNSVTVPKKIAKQQEKEKKNFVNHTVLNWLPVEMRVQFWKIHTPSIEPEWKALRTCLMTIWQSHKGSRLDCPGEPSFACQMSREWSQGGGKSPPSLLLREEPTAFLKPISYKCCISWLLPQIVKSLPEWKQVTARGSNPSKSHMDNGKAVIYIAQSGNKQMMQRIRSIHSKQ